MKQSGFRETLHFGELEESQKFADSIRFFVSQVAHIVCPCTVDGTFRQVFDPLLRRRVHVLDDVCRNSICLWLTWDTLRQTLHSALNRPKTAASRSMHSGLSSGNQPNVWALHSQNRVIWFCPDNMHCQGSTPPGRSCPSSLQRPLGFLLSTPASPTDSRALSRQSKGAFALLAQQIRVLTTLFHIHSLFEVLFAVVCVSFAEAWFFTFCKISPDYRFLNFWLCTSRVEGRVGGGGWSSKTLIAMKNVGHLLWKVTLWLTPQ